MSHGARLAELGEGEVLKGTPLVRGLTPKGVEAEVVKVTPSGVVTLDLKFMGVKLATAAGKTNGEKIAWWEGK